ncbi:hypothetical protein SLS62_003467 [Diatrype stigma]|uniref:Nudix hydrolase domain-containing protein n=1 Tax=Diatrype stigma TaxID=117547 RepID=A0AAN9UWD2_9PEZI
MEPGGYISYTAQSLGKLIGIGQPTPDTFCVGVAIAQRTGQLNRPGKPAVLLVRRTEDTDHYPGIWHLPGGQIEPTDLNVKAAIERLVFDKTNLKVTRVLEQLDYAYRGKDEETKLVANPAGGEDLVVNKVVYMINYVVEVEDLDAFRLKTDEYTSQYWIDEDMVSSLGATESVKRAVSEALVSVNMHHLSDVQERNHDEHHPQPNQ